MPTQEEIAQAVGISRMTVYRYLVGKKVKQTTRRRIESYLKVAEYGPISRRQPVLQQTKLIGLLVRPSPIPTILRSCRRSKRRSGTRRYNLLLCVSEEDPVQEKAELELLLSIPVDGIIISPTSSPESEANCSMLAKEKPPLVMFDRYFSSVNGSFVTTDSLHASARLVQHLVDLGHTTDRPCGRTSFELLRGRAAPRLPVGAAEKPH